MRKFLFLIFIFFTTFCYSAPTLDVPLESIRIAPHILNKSKSRKCALAICAIFQDEADYLKEWIEYHRLIGVNHFYLYNNRSSDHYLDVLLPYIRSGVVELFDYPYLSGQAYVHNAVQVYVYNHALTLSRGKSEWLAVIDTDEFIAPILSENLYDILRNYRFAAGLTLYWQMFGTSNVHHLEKGELMTEKLLLKAPEHCGWNRMVKSIVRPNYVKRIKDPHIAEYYPGFFAVFPNRHKFSHTPGYKELPITPIRLNHYWFRTEEFLERVKKPRRLKWEGKRSEEYWINKKELASQEYDDWMLRFSDRLRKRVYD